MDTHGDLLARLQRKEATVGVIGLGYVGLPLAVEFGRAGLSVLGFDVDAAKVEQLEDGTSYITDVPSQRIAELVDAKRLNATADFDRLAEPDAICICVPTPLTETRDPDLSFVVRTTDELAKHLRRGQLVVLESTTYPGTTREEVLPRLAASGLEVGTDFFCAYAPERVNPGSKDPPFAKVPRVVSGVTSQCRSAAVALYDLVVEQTIPVSSLEVAEMSKLLENIYRAVNVSLVNELKTICLRMDIDIWEVVEAAASKPFGFVPFYPGPGMGGHCIPIDPFYLAWRARAFGVNAHFIELAGEVNARMPELVVQRTAEALNSHGKALRGSRVLVLGVAYKPNVGDTRESPAIRILELLAGAGADIRYHDALVPQLPRMRRSSLRLASVELTEEQLQQSDCVVIVTDHTGYDYQWILDNASLVVDTRNATRQASRGREKVWAA